MHLRRTLPGLFGAYVRNNRVLLTVCTVFMIIGICAGSLYCIFLSDAQSGELLQSLGNFGALKSAQGGAVFLSSLINMLQVAFFIWLCGCTKLGVPVAPLILALKGFASGFSIAALVMLYAGTGLLAAAAGLLPQMLLMFGLMVMLCVAAINQALYAPRNGDKAEKRRRFVSYCVFCSLLFGCLVVCALIESYISPYLMVWILGL
ncbi:MAG TPA: stage II sporulation protein M [Candidatus Aphodoplasma excrementigallinarum]|uniref:Stage II sporulation protein M n=1 Tax=Candidatus Aphodoplasma excrementigallinarum TaxID=2840673 RepID=A0A9D1T021_9FIRM|nr:stage II sporulation protein M [Candidatus Aphodoplasma excrementigallinarum]